MAKISLEVDVEYARIKMFGVWFELAEVYDLLANLDEIMAGRNWRPKEQKWWVVNKDAVPTQRVAGSFSTSRDAGIAREIIERNSDLTYWIEQEK